MWKKFDDVIIIAKRIEFIGTILLSSPTLGSYMTWEILSDYANLELPLKLLITFLAFCLVFTTVSLVILWIICWKDSDSRKQLPEELIKEIKKIKTQNESYVGIAIYGLEQATENLTNMLSLYGIKSLDYNTHYDTWVRFCSELLLCENIKQAKDVGEKYKDQG